MSVSAPASDQILVFLAVVDHGSFSAAARHLHRVQSAITYAIQALEADLGVTLFDRTGGRPVLTTDGEILLDNARRVAREIETMRQRALSLTAGLEAEVSLVLETMFPMDRLLVAIRAFAQAYPAVSLRIYTESLGAVPQKVLDRTCVIGISGPVALGIDALTCSMIGTIALVVVAASSHPLAAWQHDIPLEVMRDHVQLVTTDRSSLTEGQEFGVLSPAPWRMTDLGAKHAMLVAGIGWGSLPRQMVDADLAAGRLVELNPVGFGLSNGVSIFPIYAIHRNDAQIGPAGVFLLEALKTAMTDVQ